MSLSDWERNGWLVQHRTNRKEIADLLGLADRDLRDRAAKGLSEDWQLAMRTTPLCNVRQLPWRHADIVLRARRITIASFRAWR